MAGIIRARRGGCNDAAMDGFTREREGEGMKVADCGAQWGAKHYASEEYRRARAAALVRTRRCCSLCGGEATQAHHHEREYPKLTDLREDGADLTPLCEPCHRVATALRKMTQGRAEKMPALALAVEQMIYGWRG